MQLGGAERLEVDVASWRIVLGLGAECVLQSVVGLVLECQLLAVVEHHLLDGGPFQGSEDIVLVGVDETVAGRHDIVG